MRPDGSLIDLTDAHPGKAADGGIISTASETATFLTELMEGRLLPRRALRGMQAYAFWNGGSLTRCGLVVYGHGGAGDGFKTEVIASGDGGWVAVLFLNGRNAHTDANAPGAAQRLFCAGRNP
jgi:hypothetical protein